MPESYISWLKESCPYEETKNILISGDILPAKKFLNNQNYEPLVAQLPPDRDTMYRIDSGTDFDLTKYFWFG